MKEETPLRKLFLTLLSLTFLFCSCILSFAACDANTQLMLHMNGADGSTTFTDNGITGHTVTAVGNAQIDTAQSKFGGASGLFDGTGDYLSIPDSDDWYFGTGDFTIDFWVRFSSSGLTNEQQLCGQHIDSSNYWIFEKTGAGNDRLQIIFQLGGVIKGNYIMTSAWTPSADTWYHLAVVRTSTTAKIFVNGVSQTLTESNAFSTNDVGNISSTFRIGAGYTTSELFNGWLDELRISKGIARWTSNFTPNSSNEHCLDRRGFFSDESWN